MRLYDGAYGPNPFTVRLFIAERKGLSLDIEQLDLLNLENRGERYVQEVNSRGELPAFRLDDGSVITEITAICEYLDEVSSEPHTLIGSAPKERAETRMWTRRVDLEIVQNLVNWWRASDQAVAFYRGHRILPPRDSQDTYKRLAEQGLAFLEAQLKDRTFICGDRLTLADVILFAVASTLGEAVPWWRSEKRPCVSAWYARMNDRPSVASAKEPVNGHLSV